MASALYSRLHALIVDDFDSFRMTVSKMLQDFGIDNVDTAVNGTDALRQCRHKVYDLILCDHNLGTGKTGQQVLEDMRHNRMLSASALFIMVSAESSKSIVMAAYDYEPDAYLTKPVTPKTLQQRLQRLLTQRKQMAAIYRAINNQQIDVAIALCSKDIETGSRYATQCQRLLGQLYLQTGDLPAAESIYREVLDVRPLDWAQVGMARVKQEQGDFLSAQQWLDEALGQSPMCMHAYDLQAEIYRRQGDWNRLQKVLQEAVDISPLAILRQQHLGEVALKNHDVVTAAQAFRRASRLGENSCYDQPENHLNFARATVAWYQQDNTQGKTLLREAGKALGDFDQRFGRNPDLQLAVQLADAQLSAVQGDRRRAEQLLAEARKAMDAGGLPVPLDIELDRVVACRLLNEEKEAQALLKDLIERYRHDEHALEAIDRLLEEPVSHKNRQLVAAINRRGISFYEDKSYVEACECFKDALRTFPHHIGIRLNLLQSLLGLIEVQGSDPHSLELANTTLKYIERGISPSHDQFSRFRQLSDRLRAASRETAY